MSIHSDLIQFHKLPIGYKFIYHTNKQETGLPCRNLYYIAIKTSNTGIYNATCTEHNDPTYNFKHPLSFSLNSLVEPLESISWVTI